MLDSVKAKLFKQKPPKQNKKCPEDLYHISSSVKWSDPEQFLESQGNFFCHFHVPFFYIFLTSKIMDETLKSFLGRSILHYFQIRN